AAMREAMFAKWRRALLEIGFMAPETADHMMLGIRRIFSRGPLTEKDVQILLGMAAQTQWAARHLPPKP
ncbi:MAG TPA: RNA methyltransferase, partial [Kiritimatiellia bacterium]|nr:RNA methyltransferase [Kiritimatiellia bacterium]